MVAIQILRRLQNLGLSFDSVNEPLLYPIGMLMRTVVTLLYVRGCTDSHDVIYFKVTGKGNATGGHYLESGL